MYNFEKLSFELKKRFLYEYFLNVVQMFFYSLNKNIQIKNEKRRYIDQLDNEKIVLSAYLLYGRHLLEFFYHPCSKKDNRAYAGHFVENWKNILPSKTPSIIELEKRVNNEITHLSYNRLNIDQNNKEWDTIKLLHDFMVVVKLFISKLNKQYNPENLNY